MPRLQAEVRRRLKTCNATLESAAQAWVETVYDALEESLVLARVFAILPFRALPKREQAHAGRFVYEGDAALDAYSPVLTLIATRGRMEAWNDRARSQRYLATPLTSLAAARAVPMISAMLNELGCVESFRPSTPTFGRDSVATSRLGTFYVFDARTTVDDQNRLIVPNTEFVETHDVRTVFGLGGTYGGGSLFAMILFARQHVTRVVADQLLPIAWEFKTATLAAAMRGDFFEP